MPILNYQIPQNQLWPYDCALDSKATCFFSIYYWHLIDNSAQCDIMGDNGGWRKKPSRWINLYNFGYFSIIFHKFIQYHSSEFSFQILGNPVKISLFSPFASISYHWITQFISFHYSVALLHNNNIYRVKVNLVGFSLGIKTFFWLIRSRVVFSHCTIVLIDRSSHFFENDNIIGNLYWPKRIETANKLPMLLFFVDTIYCYLVYRKNQNDSI